MQYKETFQYPIFDNNNNLLFEWILAQPLLDPFIVLYRLFQNVQVKEFVFYGNFQKKTD